MVDLIVKLTYQAFIEHLLCARGNENPHIIYGSETHCTLDKEMSQAWFSEVSLFKEGVYAILS